MNCLPPFPDRPWVKTPTASLFLWIGLAGLLSTRLFADVLPPALDVFLAEHCYDCHDDDIQKGDLNLAELRFSPVDAHNRSKWETVFERVRTGEMPPKKKERPDRDDLKAFLSALKKPILQADVLEKKTQGRVHVRRLTRVEYQYTVHDLLGIDIPFDDILPEDAVGHGFETVAKAQQLSHHTLSRYLEAADQALEEAFKRALKGDEAYAKSHSARDAAHKGPGNYRGPDLRGNQAIFYCHSLQFHGRMPRTRVPESGWYEITVKNVKAVNPGNASIWGTIKSGACASNAPLLFPIGLVEATKTARDLTFKAWIRKDHMLEFKPNESGLRQAPNGASGGNVSYKGRDLVKGKYPGIAITGIEVKRIYPNGTRNEVRDKLFPGVTAADIDALKDPARREAILERTLGNFATRVFRRPVSKAQLAPYMDLARDVLNEVDGSPLLAVRAAYRAILCSPRFLTFTEAPGELDAHSLANRLSYMLWNSMPDDELRRLADNRQILTSEVMHKQVVRLVENPKFSRFIRSFTDQWLNLRDINATTPDRRVHRTWDEVLQESLLQETRAFTHALLTKNASITHFIDSDFAMINERLKRHYGFGHVSLVPGNGIQRVSLKPNDRSGYPTQGAILKVTANGTTTSPVVRGVWVGERLLGLHIPPPPPNIPAVEPDIRGAVSIRDQLDKHRSNESCAACHAKIDPAGFALENYDPVGLWRTTYGTGKKGKPVDSSGVTPDGVAFKNIGEWKTIYSRRPEQLARGFAQQLVTYATGAPPRFSDRDSIEVIVDHAEQRDYGVRTILHAVVDSPIFRNK